MAHLTRWERTPSRVLNVEGASPCLALSLRETTHDKTRTKAPLWHGISVPDASSMMNTRLTLWSDRFKHGVVWQDRQHQDLLHCLRDLHRWISQGANANETRTSFDFLRGYIGKHFALEERYMLRYKYPNAAMHRREHDRFVRDLEALEQSFQTTPQASAAALLHNLNEWFVNHIMGDDAELARWIHEAQSSEKTAEAS